MNYFSIFKGRTRALFTDFTSLAIIIIAVGVSIFISQSSKTEVIQSIPIELVNEDEGYLGERLADILSAEEGFEFNLDSYEEAVKAVAENRAQGLIVIPEDFSQKIWDGNYESLIKLNVMADSYEMKAFTERVINDVIKVWSEVLIEKRLHEYGNLEEPDYEEYRKEVAEIWKGESLLDVNTIMMTENKSEDKEEATYFGIRWYAVFAMFYLCISGTWMCNYSGTSLLKRVSGRGGNISLLFIFQSAPGVLVSILGFIPVLITSGHPHPLKVFLAFIFYICSAAAFALMTCSLSGKFSNLVLAAPILTMAASLISGLLCELPDWAAVWDLFSCILPGHWYFNSIFDKPFFIGSVIITAMWFAIGLFTSWIAGIKKRRG